MWNLHNVSEQVLSFSRSLAVPKFTPFIQVNFYIQFPWPLLSLCHNSNKKRTIQFAIYFSISITSSSSYSPSPFLMHQKIRKKLKGKKRLKINFSRRIFLYRASKRTQLAKLLSQINFILIFFKWFFLFE